MYSLKLNVIENQILYHLEAISIIAGECSVNINASSNWELNSAQESKEIDALKLEIYEKLPESMKLDFQEKLLSIFESDQSSACVLKSIIEVQKIKRRFGLLKFKDTMNVLLDYKVDDMQKNKQELIHMRVALSLQKQLSSYISDLVKSLISIGEIKALPDLTDDELDGQIRQVKHKIKENYFNFESSLSHLKGSNLKIVNSIELKTYPVFQSFFENMEISLD